MFATRHPLYNLFKGLKGGVYTIEGIIGVGKTTFGRSVEKFLNDIGLKAKFFPEYVNKELLAQYISDMKRYAYTFQMIMLCKRIEIYREAERFAESGGIAFVDRSIIGDMTFARMQKDNGNFSASEWETYLGLMRQEIQLTPAASLFLKCSPETSLRRVHERGIQDEIKGYSLAYMQQLSDAYDETITACTDVRHITLDWNAPVDIVDGCINTELVHAIVSKLL